MMEENEGESESDRMKDQYRKRIRESMEDRYRKRKERWGEDVIVEMGFDGLNSLHQTIEHLLRSFAISIDPHSRELLICAGYGVKEAVEYLKSLKEFSDLIERETMKVVEEKIREAARELEDVLDSHVSDQFLSQSETGETFQLVGDEEISFLFSLSLQGIEQDVDGFIQKVMNMEKLLNPWFKEEEDGDGSGTGKESESDQSGASVTRTWLMSWFATKAASTFLGKKEDYIQDLGNLFPEEECDDDCDFLFGSDFSRSYPKDRCSKLKNGLITWWINKAAPNFVMEKDEEDEKKQDDDVASPENEYAGNMVGLTDLFCKIRNDLIQERGFIRMGSIVGMAGIGKTALAKKILQDPLISSKFELRIFVRMGPKYQPEEITQAILAQFPDEDKIPMVGHRDVHEYLHETLKVKKCLIVLDDVWDQYLWYTLLNKIYPLESEESSLLVTTRKNQVAEHVEGRIYNVPFLNKEESWDLLRGKIFGEKVCLREFEKAGKKIAENCEGLPLLIVTVADLLSEAEKTPKYWSKIAADKTNSIFVGAYEQIYEVVYPSYSDLPRYLKVCFLYFGAFPQNDEIRLSKLICLWSAEGFLGVGYTTLQHYVHVLLKKMVSNNVVLVTQWSCTFNKYKACSLHSVFWYMCKREAWKEKFLLVLNSYKDASVEGIESRRRLSIYKNTILSIKDVRDPIASMSVVRSLLCPGPYHQYQVPIFFGLRLLKVLDALTIRFYEFPMEVFKLIQLRYLALTCNENLPPSISQLWSIQSLILHQNLSTKSSVSQSYLPVEIWDLQQLEYLQIPGRNLPDPPLDGALSGLLILLDVGALNCTELVLKSIPYLEKLRVEIELMPVDAGPLRLFDDISHLNNITSLQFVVVNLALVFEINSPAPLFSASYVRKLTLSGFGYPWKDMNKIAELPCLEVLKLKCYAFRGEMWEVKDMDFQKLKYLLVEDTDLVHWTGVIRLEYLTIKNCYKLQEIPRIPPFMDYLTNNCNKSTPREIRVVDCNPSAAICAKQNESERCNVYVDSSWLRKDKLS